MACLQLNGWESDFFGKRIYTLDLGSFSVKALSQEWKRLRPQLCVVKLSVSGAGKVLELFSAGFYVIGTSVVFSKICLLSADDENCRFVRRSENADLPSLLQIVQEGFEHSRFNDPFFAGDGATRLYSKWIENAIAGTFDDACLCVCEPRNNEISGLLSYRTHGTDCRIGLFATKNSHKRRGNGRKLISALERIAVREGCKRIVVETQGENEKAVCAYAKYGFSPEQASLWLYKKE